MKGMGRIAPLAPKVATRGPDKDAGLSRIGRFALDAFKDFIDFHNRRFGPGLCP
jgi:hypothetical protein